VRATDVRTPSPPLAKAAGLRARIRKAWAGFRDQAVVFKPVASPAMQGRREQARGNAMNDAVHGSLRYLIGVLPPWRRFVQNIVARSLQAR
jgi:hypothetical protein